MKVNKCICDRCHKEYTPVLKETNQYKYRVSTTEGKLHLMDICPDCLADLENFVDGYCNVVDVKAE